MKKYKMAVSDFDGTLLRSDDTVSERTRRTIRAFRDSGGVFAVSTGRMDRSVRQRVAETGIEGNFPLMSYQGALVRDSLSGETLFSCPMERESVRKMLEACRKRKLYCQYYGFDDVFVPYITPENTEYCRMNRVTPVVAGDLIAHFDANPLPTAKVLVITPPETRAAVARELSAVMGDEAQVFVSGPWLVEAVSPRAGKHNGLKFAAGLYGIDVADVIAVGDEMNDAGMLRAAGLGVAMGNASETVKACADEVTDTNDNDGVAKLIEKYCL